MDKICFSVLGNDVLNFKSPTAYKYFTEAKDNHKSWQAFKIFLHGLMLELIHTFSLQCKEDIGPIGFLKWQRETTSGTMKLIFQLVLAYALGIYAQRVGDRNNDIHVSDAGRYAFIDWFYGFKHPIYREIQYQDLRNKALYPEEVKRQRSKNFSFSSTDIDARNQGGDFLLEQKVKRQKMLAPKGVVKKETWKCVSRSVDDVDVVCKNTFQFLQILDNTRSRSILLSPEIKEWTVILRDSEYLFQENGNSIVHNINGEELNEELSDLSINLTEKHKKFWTAHANGIKLENIHYKNIEVHVNHGICDIDILQDDIL